MTWLYHGIESPRSETATPSEATRAGIDFWRTLDTRERERAVCLTSDAKRVIFTVAPLPRPESKEWAEFFVRKDLATV